VRIWPHRRCKRPVVLSAGTFRPSFVSFPPGPLLAAPAAEVLQDGDSSLFKSPPFLLGSYYFLLSICILAYSTSTPSNRHLSRAFATSSLRTNTHISGVSLPESPIAILTSISTSSKPPCPSVFLPRHWARFHTHLRLPRRLIVLDTTGGRATSDVTYSLLRAPAGARLGRLSSRTNLPASPPSSIGAIADHSVLPA
jgi:hypothetical protein